MPLPFELFDDTPPHAIHSILDSRRLGQRYEYLFITRTRPPRRTVGFHFLNSPHLTMNSLNVITAVTPTLLVLHPYYITMRVLLILLLPFAHRSRRPPLPLLRLLHLLSCTLLRARLHLLLPTLTLVSSTRRCRRQHSVLDVSLDRHHTVMLDCSGGCGPKVSQVVVARSGM